MGQCGIAVEDIERLHLLVMFGCMVFAGIVGTVEDAHEDGGIVVLWLGWR